MRIVSKQYNLVVNTATTTTTLKIETYNWMSYIYTNQPPSSVELDRQEVNLLYGSGRLSDWIEN